MIEKDIRKLLDLVEEKSTEKKQQLNESQTITEGKAIARKIISEGRIANFRPPFTVMGNWVNDSRGRGVCEMGESREALKDIADALNAWVKQGVAEAAKWRSDDLEDKTWRNADWDDGDMSSGKIAIDRSGKDVDDSGDELRGRPGSWRGAADMAKRMTKKGVPTKAELGFQNILKHRIKHQKRMGGITGPKGQLPEGQDVAESKSLIKQGISKALMEGYWEDIGKAVMNYKGKELPLSSKKLDVTTDSPHYKLHPEEFKKDVYDQLKDKGLPVAKRPAPSRKVGGLSITPELLHQVWYKLENVVSNVVPDGDPIDWMAPYIRKMGVDPFHTRKILDMAVKKHYDKKADYSSYLKDMWDAYGEMQGSDYKNPWG